MKKPFVTKEMIEEIVKTYPTPFHIYDEKGIRENAKACDLFICEGMYGEEEKDAKAAEYKHMTMYEAAQIESATSWEIFWKITIPMISPMMLLNIIYTLVNTFIDIDMIKKLVIN